MQALADFFSFPLQCCDAEAYLHLGQACAESGVCYDKLRPVGSILWFSIPYRLGLPPDDVLIGLHLLLAIISIILSVWAALKIIRPHIPENIKNIYLILFITIGSTLSHILFLQPTLRTALSDTAASLFALIAVWLLVLITSQRMSHFIMLALAGLCMGLAAWIRIFFLYPVLFTLLTWFVMWTSNNKKHIADLLLFIALLPISVQFYTTWKHTNTLSYIDPNVTQKLLTEHRDNKSIGYDMVLDSRGIWNWFSDCPEYNPLIQALQERDLHSLNCLISGRINFYLGSYSAYNFVSLGGYNKLWGESLLKNWKENKHEKNIWQMVNMQRNEGVVTAPDNTISADRLTKIDPGKMAEVYQIVELKSSTNPYAFSTWLWGEENQSGASVKMIIRNHETKNIVAEKEITLAAEKEVKFLNAMIPTDGLYDAVIQLPAEKSSASFYLWEELDLRLPEPNIENVKVSKIRLWSRWLLLANSLAFVIATALLSHKIISRQATKQRRASDTLAFIFLILICGQAILSLPEQRFAITPMIAAWVLCLSCITLFLSNKISTWRGKHSGHH